MRVLLWIVPKRRDKIELLDGRPLHESKTYIFMLEILRCIAGKKKLESYVY